MNRRTRLQAGRSVAARPFVPRPRTARRRAAALFVLLVGVLTIASALSEWVGSYGTRTPYPDALYYTGFGLARRSGNDAAALEAARTRAKSDLISKIRVQVRSTITSREGLSTTDAPVVATVVSESIASLDIENVGFDVEKNMRNLYVLARVAKSDLASFYRRRLDAVVARVVELHEQAKRYESDGDGAAALTVYARLSTELEEAYRIVGILDTVVRGTMEAAPFPVAVGDRRLTERDFSAMGVDAAGALERLRFGRSRDIEAAMSLMLVQLADQEVPRGSFRVGNLTFADSDYSSAFGAYAAEAIGTTLARRYGGGGVDLAVRGSYRIEGERIVLRLIVQNPSGKIVGSSTLRFPVDSLAPDIELRPRNFEQALVDRREIVAGAVIDGGISVEVWTNKGRNADRLVFVEGETIEFYFRVNQPCYLMLTYILATGEKVLLDESFYIGQDKVNLVVRYPTQFEPVPPFGVERLLVTAYEEKPPAPDVVVRTIEGVDYPVFRSMRAVYSTTRGIRPKARSNPDREMRVGEAALVMTTVAPREHRD